MICAICKKEITGSTAIMSSKGQVDTVNHYGLERFSEGSNLVARTNIKFEFSFDRDGSRADLCKKCFGAAIRELCEAGKI